MFCVASSCFLSTCFLIVSSLLMLLSSAYSASSSASYVCSFSRVGGTNVSWNTCSPAVGLV